MKAVISNRKDIMLSVTMIVKNEEKTLERCLRSLKPLLEQVNGELIITDTGSTDTTVEIAQKYADKLLHYEWSNDFAAARNVGLEQCGGKWVMFLDADEFLDEDISEMITFFNTPQFLEKYECCTFVCRNYYNVTRTSYGDFYATRLFKHHKDTKFVGKIHENILSKFPIGCFSTILHHTGYCYVTEKEGQNKHNRNMQPLLDELKTSKHLERVYCHINSMVSGMEKEKYLNEWYDYQKSLDFSGYTGHCYLMYIQHLINEKWYSKAIDMTKEYFNIDGSEKSVCAVGIYYLMTQAYYFSHSWAECEKSYQNYIEYYNRYKKNKLDNSALLIYMITGIQQKHYDGLLLFYVQACENLKKYGDALSLLGELDYTSMSLGIYRETTTVLAKISAKSEDYATLVSIYKKSLNTDKSDLAEKMLTDCYYQLESEQRVAFTQYMVNNDLQGIMGIGFSLVAYEKSTNISDNLAMLVSTVTAWNSSYSEIIWLALKNGVNISQAIEKMNFDTMQEITETLSKNHEDYCDIVSRINYADYITSIKALTWIKLALTQAVARCSRKESDVKHGIFDMYICCMCDYVSNVFNSELLNDEDIVSLSGENRFGYFIGRGYEYLENGDNTHFMKCVTLALAGNDNLREVIEYIIEKYNNSQQDF